jgi:prophage regulatory protein
MQTILRLPAVKARTGLATSIYQLARAGAFPRPIKLGAKASGWIQSEVDEFLARRIAESRAAEAK